MHGLYLAEVNATFLRRRSVSIESSVKPLHILGNEMFHTIDDLIPEIKCVARAVALVAVA